MVGAKEYRDDLSLERVVQAAVVLLDEEGMDAFSMRALAAHLGRSAMAAYRHVENRESLIRLAAESVQQDPPDLGPLPWYERLEAIARHGWTTCWRPHPWVVDFIGSGAITPKAIRRLAVMEEVFRDAGFDGAQTDKALTAHWSFVIGTLRMIMSIRATAGSRGTHHEDAIFDFNLNTWVLGLNAMAQGIDQGALSRGALSRVAKS
jgi:AcrR family transcriptional regulator